MFFNLRCHYCGQRSPYSKGTSQFQCAKCEAINYYDSAGNIVDVPADIVAGSGGHAQQPAPHTFSRSISQEVPQQDNAVFCKRCRTNQQIYTEALANYLPDEDHPQYAEFEASLPQARANLEQKYPLVCTKCAKNVQQKIHSADYYGKTQQTARMMTANRRMRASSPTGRRDDWGKWMMRMLLNVLGMIVYASLLMQVAWHAYGMLTAVTNPSPIHDDGIVEDTDFAFDPTLRDCAHQTRLLRFDSSCFQLFATFITKALIVSLCLLWYNPGIKMWYHHTYRVEAVHGQTEYFRVQVILLIARTIGWFKLSGTSNASALSKQQLLAAHGFMIASTFICQWLSERAISSDRWTLKGKIMPRPDEVDVFSATAGPAEEPYNRQASSVHPQARLFPRDERPFPIEKLAPKPQTRRGYSKLESPIIPPPSPPDSQSLDSDDDAMDIDTSSYAGSNYGGSAKRPVLRSTYNHSTTQPLGWGAIRNSLFDIQDSTRAADERKRKEDEERAKLRYQPPVEQNPFRGRLPPAPMSMERRLRNPPTQVAFKKAPLSKQQDFMKQMREGVEAGKGFARPKPAAVTPKQKPPSYANGFALSLDDDDDEFSPVKSRSRASNPSIDETVDAFTPAKARTKGSLDLRPSSWTLKSDLASATGLEDMFGGQSFTIRDEADAADVRGRAAVPERDAGGNFFSTRALLVLGLIGVVVAVAAVQPLRRMVCLWLVGQLEGWGY